jgi:protein gp37
MDAAWVRELRTACERQGVPFFFKQWGGKRKNRSGRMLDGRTWDDYPISGRLKRGARGEFMAV